MTTATIILEEKSPKLINTATTQSSVRETVSCIQRHFVTTKFNCGSLFPTFAVGVLPETTFSDKVLLGYPAVAITVEDAKGSTLITAASADAITFPNTAYTIAAKGALLACSEKQKFTSFSNTDASRRCPGLEKPSNP